jgi:DNA-directed RNA polymerase subunit RPC12/RpoP
MKMAMTSKMNPIICYYCGSDNFRIIENFPFVAIYECETCHHRFSKRKKVSMNDIKRE